jgi:broad-specificity NMP kinase
MEQGQVKSHVYGRNNIFQIINAKDMEYKFHCVILLSAHSSELRLTLILASRGYLCCKLWENVVQL